MRYSTLYFILIAGIILVIFAGATVPVMDVDAAQYASISREMSQTGSFLKVYNGGRDYLDKPPLLFWLSSISIWLFGISSWAYKIPSILFSLWAAWAINRLGRKWFNPDAGDASALIWMSCQGFFLMNLDVRTDLLLTSNIILAIWQFDKFLSTQKILSGVWAGFFTGLAMLAKGPLGLILPGIAVGILLLQQRNYRMFLLRFNIWIWLPILILVLTPMTIGLYQQFGLEGVYFYYWKQSFGRITGENEWRNDAGPFFLTQNLLWAALPWTFAWIGALSELIRQMKENFQDALRSKAMLLLGCVLIPLIVLSRSHYQLPHYIFVVLPFLSLMTGAFLSRLEKQRVTPHFLMHFHVFLALLIMIAAWFLEFFVLSSQRMEFRLIWGSISILILVWLFRNGKFRSYRVQLLLLPAFTACVVNMYLNMSFYQGLMPYQPSIPVSAYFQQSGNSVRHLFIYRYGASHSLDFYTGKTNFVIYEPKDVEMVKAEYLLTNEEGFRELFLSLPGIKLLRVYPEYPVQFISLPFLNPQTRAEQVRKIFLIKV